MSILSVLKCSIVFLGNNVYGSEICQVLEQVKESTERAAYIVMDKIHPTPVRNYLMRQGSPLKISNCLSELGVFGAYVRYVCKVCVCVFQAHTLWKFAVMALRYRRAHSVSL